MGGYYVLDGHEAVPCADVLEWGRAFGDTEKRRVAATEIGDIHVSTVFLGLDHSFGEGPPMIFETMIFGGDHDEDQWRYSTWEEAEKGHAAAVALVEEPA